jgi:hypothetical protein
MSSGVGRGNTLVMVSLFAAIAILGSMLLPWVAQGNLAPSYSYFDLMSGKTVIQVGWLTAGMLAVGALLAAGGAGSRLLNPASGRGAAKTAVAGFAAALAGFGLWFVLWAKVDQAYGWLGVQMGIGVLVGIAAAVTGLVASIADLRSMPSNGMESSQTGVWSAPPAPAQLQPAMGLQGSAPTQVSSPQGSWSAAGASGRISYVEGGRLFSLPLNAGQELLVGRGATASIRLSDTKVSREHATIAWNGGSWVVRDLEATNPTRLLGASGSAQAIAGEIHIASGQLLIGEVLLTLFPAGS